MPRIVTSKHLPYTAEHTQLPASACARVNPAITTKEVSNSDCVWVENQRQLAVSH